MGLLGDIMGGVKDAFNLGAQIENTMYNRKQQDIQREREDTAVQRRKADLIAAGMSPILAAGSAATSSSPINVGVPQVSGEEAMRAINMENARKTGAVTEAQLRLVREQGDKTAIEKQSVQSDYDVKKKMNDYLLGDLVIDPKAAGYESLPPYAMLATSSNAAALAQSLASQRSALDVIRNSDMARASGLPVTSEALAQIQEQENLNNALGATDVGKVVLPWIRGLKQLLPR